MSESPNQITPRHLAVLLILREVREVQERIDDNQRDVNPTDLFRSQIFVHLQRTRELLLLAVAQLEAHAGDDESP